MSDVLKGLLRQSGITEEDFEAQRKAARESDTALKPKRGVSDSQELARILALPRRSWETYCTPDIVERVSAHLRNPQWLENWKVDPRNAKKPVPTSAPMLRPVQVASLCEIHDYRGMLGSQRVGAGKTLTTLLAPNILDPRPKKPLLLVPAKLLEKTRREMHSYRQSWLIVGYIKMMSYELLGRPQSAKELEQYGPDMIIADEAHRLKNTGAAVVKRVKRYMNEHPETIFIALSGTITKRSLHDYAHISQWACKRSNPVPTDFNTRMEWSIILDEKPRIDNEGLNAKLAPGALIRLCNDEERQLYKDDPVRAVRKGFRRRFVDTPGIVATQEGALAMSLRIESELVAMPEPAAHEAVKSMRQKWERPDGEPIMDAIELWRHLREIACGFWYRWNPNPPREWMADRRAWTKTVREILRDNRRGLDSEFQVKKAVLEGHYPNHTGTLAQWLRSEPTFKPNPEAVWVSTAVLDRAAKWMEEEKGIVWVEHVEFGQALATKTGVSFFQRGGVDQFRRAIEDHPTDQPMICSIASNAEGRNLQAWSSNLIVSPPTSGQTWEQLLGRTHRDGQEADEVSVTLLVTLKEQVDAFERACRDARYISDVTGQEQKLCYADITVIESNSAPILPNGGR